MTHITRSALVMHSAEAMFDLVNDVSQYPEFLPGCRAARVLESSGSFIEAELTLSKAGFEQSFITRNHLTRPERMEITLVEGPFSRFAGHWQFQPLSDDACKVSLELHFEMGNPITGAAMGALFKQVAGMMVDAFVKRAKVVYG
ncbi:MAG: type II toxin-antitoxin system RatA family toxin [Oleibacter sp.]|nr:type II toxin-antitoxin system RatA family toxin [Thalassolituus sp.]